MELQIFQNAEFGSVRSTMIGGEPFFVGKDVAEILGYADPNKAIAMHVDEEDKLNDKTASSLGQRGGWLINESGLYGLILSSKLPAAKRYNGGDTAGKRVWEGTDQEVNQYGRGYLICSGGGDRSGYLRVITDGQIRELKNEQIIKDIIGSYGYTGSYIYDDRIYMFCDGKVTVYNISTGETGPLVDGRLDDKELRTIEAITGDRLYYSSMAGGEYHIYSVDRDSFFNGDLSESVKME